MPHPVELQWRAAPMPVLALALALTRASAQAPTARALLAAEARAAGGEAWRAVAAVRLAGTVVAGGAPGTFVHTVDARTGHDRLAVQTGAFVEESGYDGVGWDWQNGILTAVDLPGLVADARTQAFLARGGWRAAGDATPARRLEPRADAGVACDVVALTPAGGSPVELWLDRSTHLVRRAVLHADGGDLTTEYADWRLVGGVRVPFRRVERDPTGQVTAFRARSAAVRPTLPPDAVARPAARPHGTLAGGGPTTVPFQLTGVASGHVVVDARIDGRPSALTFDTGAADYLAPDAARRLGLTIGGGINIGGVGSASTTGGFAWARTIAVGGARLGDEVVIVGPLPYVALHPRAGLVADGLAGFEFLSEFRTTLDYARRTLTFAPFAAPRDGAARADEGVTAGATLPFYSDGHAIYVEAAVEGARGLFRLDTGDGGTVSVFRAFADAHGLTAGAGGARTLAGGVGGAVAARNARVRTFTLAGTTFDDVPADLIGADAGAFASRSVAGNIGAGLLSRFRLTFDYRARTVTFAPGDRLAAPFPRDWVGLALDQHDARALVVLSVAPGSAAAAAGVRAGDAVLALDGASVAGRRLGVFDLAPLRAARAPFRVTVRRGGRTRTAVLAPDAPRS